MGNCISLGNVYDFIRLLSDSKGEEEVLMDTSDNGWIHLKVGEKTMDIVLDE